VTEGLDPASREMIRHLREAADARTTEDPPRGLVADAAGGDPILWDNEQREVPRGSEHSRD
jgi:hypothetical protein